MGGIKRDEAAERSSSSVVDAVDSAVVGRSRAWNVVFSCDDAEILDGSPCIGCVSIGTGGGIGKGLGVDMSTAVVGLEGVDRVPGSVAEPSLPSPSRLLRSSNVIEP